jgi:hypothetical protein
MPLTIINSIPKKKLYNSMQTNMKQKRVPKITKTNPFCCIPMRNLELHEIERCFIKPVSAHLHHAIYIFTTKSLQRGVLKMGKQTHFN